MFLLWSSEYDWHYGPRQTATIRTSMEVAAMAEFLRQCWFLLLHLYQTIQSNGFIGCLAAFVLAGVMSKIAGWLSGRTERLTGTANIWLCRLGAALLQTGAAVLFLVTVIATLKLLLYG